jgi:hypothetical protein
MSYTRQKVICYSKKYYISTHFIKQTTIYNYEKS